VSPALRVRDLTVRFAGAPAAVVDGISFEVAAGRTLAVVGESGCGKSVTSMALMGLLPPSATITAGATTFLDEPLLGRNEAAWRDIRGNRLAMIFQETGAAMILITHDLGVVAEVADDVAVMYAGRIVEGGPVAALFDDPQHPYTIGLMGSMPSHGPRGGRLATISGRVPTPAEMPPGCRFATRCPFVIEACRAARPPLRAMSPGHEVACIRAPPEQHLGAAA
jgi:peptide/nickel transport system ATP-binding protein